MTKTKKNKVMILVGVFLSICMVIFGINLYQEKTEEIKSSEAQILSISKEDVSKLSWNYNDETYSFTKEESWSYDADKYFPVNDHQIEELLSIFDDFQSSFKIENSENYDQYGLSNPIGTINITTKDQSYTIQLGDFSKMDEQRYVSIGDGNVYLVKEDPLEVYDISLQDLILNDDVSCISSNINAIVLSGKESYKIAYDEKNDTSYDAEDVYFANEKPLDTEKVNLFVQKISSLDLTKYVTYNASEKELVAYGLNTPEQKIKIQYIDDENEKKNIMISASTKDDLYYVRINDSKILYEITEDEYTELMACSYDDLRHEEVVIPSFENVTKVVVSMKNQEYMFVQEKEKWKYKDQEIEFEEIQYNMQELNSVEFVSEKDSNREEIRFTLYLKDGREYEVQIHQKDGSYCLAIVNEETTSTVLRSDIVDLMESINSIVLND